MALMVRNCFLIPSSYPLVYITCFYPRVTLSGKKNDILYCPLFFPANEVPLLKVFAVFINCQVVLLSICSLVLKTADRIHVPLNKVTVQYFSRVLIFPSPHWQLFTYFILRMHFPFSQHKAQMVSRHTVIS